MKRAVSLITETAAWLTSLSGALAQKYNCIKTKIQQHNDKNTMPMNSYFSQLLSTPSFSNLTYT